MSKLESFGDRLYRILLDRNMSQTDLARLVFNESRYDKRGYEVVVGKDAISQYINGKATPTPKRLKRIADALKVPVDELAPELLASTRPGAASAIKIEAIAGHIDKVLLQIRRIVPLETAVRIAGVLSELEHQKQ